jgi:beta-lactamase superfamily II metal-dependent hydrolase
MAPQHGSRLANTRGLAEWARPKVVVSCQGPLRWPARAVDPYSATGAQVFGTWPHGAVTIRSRATDLVVETFQTGQRMLVRWGHREGPGTTE